MERAAVHERRAEPVQRLAFLDTFIGGVRLDEVMEPVGGSGPAVAAALGAAVLLRLWDQNLDGVVGRDEAQGLGDVPDAVRKRRTSSSLEGADRAFEHRQSRSNRRSHRGMQGYPSRFALCLVARSTRHRPRRELRILGRVGEVEWKHRPEDPGELLVRHLPEPERILERCSVDDPVVLLAGLRVSPGRGLDAPSRNVNYCPLFRSLLSSPSTPTCGRWGLLRGVMTTPGDCHRDPQWNPVAKARRSVPSAGGCRCAEGGTPDPCPRDGLARPGVKLEPPQPPAGRLTVPAGRHRRRGGTTLTPVACRAGW